MRKIEREIGELLAEYRKKGSKKNRRDMSKLAARACCDIASHAGIHSVHQIGNRHIVQFFRAARASGLTYKTLMNYWYALAQVYRALGRGEPPRPWKPASQVDPRKEDGAGSDAAPTPCTG